jgi:hypothetical protein
MISEISKNSNYKNESSRRRYYMPTTYTHYKFGKDVIEALPRSLKESIVKNRQLFDIGVHGPDILFYIFSPFKGNVRSTGTGLHKQPSREFFEHSKEIIKNSHDPVAARAYMYGFITHFVLDSECHKYVEKMIQASGVGHNEIETEFDAYILRQEKRNPFNVNRTKHLHPSFENSKVIAPFFNNSTMENQSLGSDKSNDNNSIKEITPLDIKRTIMSQILLHKILTAKTSRKLKILNAITRLRKDGESIRGLIINETPNPKCLAYNELLKKVYSASIPLAVSLIMQYQKYLFQDETLSSRFDLTYGEGEDWEKIVL